MIKVPQGRCQVLTSGAPYRPPRRGQQLLLTHDAWPRSTDGLEQLEAEIALVEWRLNLMRNRLAKLRKRKPRKPSMARISKLEPV